MHTASYTNQSVHFRAMGGSIALHALLAVWALSAASTAIVELPQQQMIEVTLIAGSSTEPSAKPHISEPAPMLRSKPAATQKSSLQTLETAKARQAEDTPPSQPDVHSLSVLSPATGEQKGAASESMQAVITKPLFEAEYLRNPAPEYPALAKRRNMEGNVMLDVLVTADGHPRIVRIAESSGFAMLDESAKNAISRWKFVPARRGGETIEARVIVPIEFKLQ